MIEKFQEFEYKSGILYDSIDEFMYWIYIRDKIYSKIAHLEPESSNSNSSYSTLDTQFGTNVFKLTNSKIGLDDIFNVAKNLTVSNPLLYKRKKDILIFPSPRRTLVDGKYFALWTDEISDHYGSACVNAEFLNITKHLKPYWNSNVIEMDLIDVYPVLLCKVAYQKMRRIREQVYKKCESLHKQIIEYLKIDLDINYLINLVSTRYIWWKKKKLLLKKFILNISPKVILEVSSYSTNNLVINEIASELGICTIELQHGIIGSEHIGYNYKKSCRVLPCFPKKLFVFADYWKKTCSFPIGGENIIPVGYPYAEMQKRKYPKIDRYDEMKRILVLSQPIFHSKFCEMLIELVELLDEQGIQYEIVLKLHPTEYNLPMDVWNNIINNKHFKVINTSDIPLYELFANSDIQIGATSTSIFEGLIYNLYTIVCNFGDARRRMKDLCDLKYAYFANSTKEIANLIASWRQMKCVSSNTNIFFIPNALENICKLIDEELGKS